MHSMARPWRRARTTNSTASSFRSTHHVTTEPSGDGIHELSQGGGGIVPCSVLFIPFGTGDDNDVLLLRILGWRRINPTTTELLSWKSFILASFTCTLGARVGTASTMVNASQRYADTLVVIKEPTYTADTTREGDIKIFSPADDTEAWAEVSLNGVEKIEFDFDDSTGDPTGMNALFTFTGP